MRPARSGVLGDRDRLQRPVGVGAGVVDLAVARARLGLGAAVGMVVPGVVLDPAAAETFVLERLELLEPAAFDRAETLEPHDTPLK